MAKDRSIIKDKTFNFAIRIVRLYKHLTESKKEFILSKQLLRSGTSIGANVREAHNGESSADFIHKLSIAQKECDEVLYWLELMKATEYLSPYEFDAINNDATEILKMLKSIIITVKKQKSQNQPAKIS